ncbi:MAG: AAA family ATPase [Deltaproteobacteria bacterium]|nr:AAA family ATPase [Deltaproteobacteria bacterium]
MIEPIRKDRENGFARLLAHGGCYADKTGLIRKLFDECGGPFVFGRPPGFGKTLLLDAIQMVAEGDPVPFSGLEIGKPDSGHKWKSYPVIRIDMKDIDPDPDGFDSSLSSELRRIRDGFGLESSPDRELYDLGDLLFEIAYRDVFAARARGEDEKGIPHLDSVVLVDNFDWHLTDFGAEPKSAERIWHKLLHFFTLIKACSEHVEMAFIAGVSRFMLVTIFGGMNTKNDICLDDSYAALCGITRNELLSAFAGPLDAALSALKRSGEFGQDATAEDLADRLEEWYGGYSFDGRTRLINPGSLAAFLEHASFRDYWSLSSAPVLLRRLGLGSGDYKAAHGKDLLLGTHYPDINEDRRLTSTQALTLAGCLAVGREDDRHGMMPSFYHLTIPNREIREAVHAAEASGAAPARGPRKPKRP